MIILTIAAIVALLIMLWLLAPMRCPECGSKNMRKGRQNFATTEFHCDGCGKKFDL